MTKNYSFTQKLGGFSGDFTRRLEKVSIFDKRFWKEPPENTVPPTHEFIQSIIDHGVITPIAVAEKGKRWELKIGNRRLWASRIAYEEMTKAGLSEESLARISQIYVIIYESPDSITADMWSIIDNVQRSDNPIAHAAIIVRMIREYGLEKRLDELAAAIGKTKAYVEALLRKWGKVPQVILEATKDGKISPSITKEIAHLKAAHIQGLVETFEKNGTITPDDIKAAKQFRTANAVIYSQGSMDFEDIPDIDIFQQLKKLLELSDKELRSGVEKLVGRA